MLTQPLLEKLTQLRLSAFRTALEDQLQNPQYADLSFEERLGLLVDIEITRRTNNRLLRRLKSARFPLQATIEDLDLSASPEPMDPQPSQCAGSRPNRGRQNLLVVRIGAGCL